MVAHITSDGRLEDANRGFLRLMAENSSAPETQDVRALFASPRFDELAARRADPFDGSVYRGLFTFRMRADRVAPLRGAIYSHQSRYIVVAEHEIAQLQTLRTGILKAQDELAAKEQHVVHLETRVGQLRELADAALRDRDALLDALAQGTGHQGT